MTTSLVPSARSTGVRRILAMVTVLPVTLRAAVTPSAMMVDGLTRSRSCSSQILQRFDFVIVRPFVQPSLAPHLVFEMFDGIGDVGVAAGDAGILQRGIENAAGRTDERFAGEIFLIARLLADEHEVGQARSLARHRLGGIAVERAAPAIAFGLGERAQGFDRLAIALVPGLSRLVAIEGPA